MYGLKAQKLLAQGSALGIMAIGKAKLQLQRQKYDFRLFQVDSDKLLHLSDGSDNLMHG